MSAQIPETMLLSDLLKATGYDCPEELQGRTFAEATAGGDVQTNKASTIDVSAYTEPIVIKPDTDYESMKKNTVTLSNIPQTKTEVDLNVTENGEYTPEEGEVYKKVTVAVPVGVTKLYCWINSTSNHTAYLFTDATMPQVGDKAILIKYGQAGNIYLDTTMYEITEVKENQGYILATIDGNTYLKNAAHDVSLV